MTTISMTEARRMIIACYHANEPFLMLGKPGTGKTAMFESVCNELDIGHIDFRLSMRDPVDVGGMHIPDTKTGRLKHYAPDDLPNEKTHGKTGIIVFDEINVVGQLMQATSYGLIQERRTGAYRMPAGWVPMAAGNNVSDRAAAQRIGTALANRFLIVQVEPDVKSWLEQFGYANVDPRACAFLQLRQELFHVMPTPDQLQFPTARSWTKAFKFIDETPAFRCKMVAAAVGQAAADEFEMFMRMFGKIPTFDQIVADPKNAAVPDEPGLNYALCGMLSRMVERKTVDKVMQYVCRLQPDYQVMMTRSMIARDQSLTNTSAYGSWAVANQEVMA